jgi:hypothetical protein
MRNPILPIMLLLSLIVFCRLTSLAQSGATVPPTEISADMGTCSALITVTGTDSKPIFNAKVSTRIKYGMMGVKKLELETFTSANGQVKIVKLPEVPKKPIYIYITKDDKWANVEFQPDVHCQANFDVVLK